MKTNKMPKLERLFNEHFVASIHYYKNEIPDIKYTRITNELQEKIKQIFIGIVKQLVKECEKCAPNGHGTCKRWEKCLEEIIKKARL